MPKFTLPSFLHRSRHGVYGLRWVVPRDLRDRLPRREFRWSLHTRDREEARTLVRRLVDCINVHVRQIRQVKFEEGVALGEQLLKALGAETARDRAAALSFVASESVDERLVELGREHLAVTKALFGLQDTIQVQVQAFIGALQGMPPDAIDAAAADWMSEMQALKNDQNDLRARLSRLLVEMQGRAHALLLDRQEGELRGQFDAERVRMNQQATDMLAIALQRGPASAPVAPRTSTPAHPEPPTSPPLSSVLIDFLGYKDGTKRAPKAETIDGYRDTVNLFIECFGDLPITAVDRRVGQRFVETLAKLPPGRNKNPAYRNLSVKQLVALNTPAVYASRSVNKHIDRMSTLFKWALTAGDYGLAKNPIQGLGVPDVPVKNRRAYGSEDLARLFGSEPYRQGSFEKPFQYWLPLMGLLTGARLSELAQLHVADVVESAGCHCISINTADDEGLKSLKNANSVRLVPIHSDLVRLGLLSWVQVLRARKQLRLFPEIPVQAKKTFSHAPSKWFGGYRKRCGITTPELDFHSLRVTFISALLNQGSPQVQVAQLVGHEKGLITGDVYFDPDVQPLSRLVELLKLPDSVRSQIARFSFN
jgi:integrase